jgi:arylsulfatase
VASFAADTNVPHAPIFFKHEGNRGLRVGDWKIVASGNQSPWELYDLATDRIEQHDLASAQPQRLAGLTQLWEQLDREYAKEGATGKPLPRKNNNSKAKAAAKKT